MIKKLFLLLVFLSQLYFNPAFAHVLHYQNLNRLEFDLYRNNELIGQHIYLFDRNGQNLSVHNKINFKIKVFGVTVYRYFSEGHEKYVNGKFESFSATTNHNNKEKYCKIYNAVYENAADGLLDKGHGAVRNLLAEGGRLGDAEPVMVLDAQRDRPVQFCAQLGQDLDAVVVPVVPIGRQEEVHP